MCTFLIQLRGELYTYASVHTVTVSFVNTSRIFNVATTNNIDNDAQGKVNDKIGVKWA